MKVSCNYRNICHNKMCEHYLPHNCEYECVATYCAYANDNKVKCTINEIRKEKLNIIYYEKNNIINEQN